MFIIPVQDRIDWRNPPLLTLGLIVVNCLIYFLCVQYDQRIEEQIAEQPTSLIATYEWPLYLDYVGEQDPAYWIDIHDASEQRREDLIQGALMDRHYGAWLHQQWQSTPPGADWRQQRENFEHYRDQLSWIRWGIIPARNSIVGNFASMFLHGDIWHLFGNMLFLLLFAAPLERHWGIRYLLPIYLLGGIGGNLAYVITHLDGQTPGIGASGAISALMGAYAATYGVKRIEYFYSVGIFFGSFTAPALIVFPIWFGYELIQNLLSEGNVNYMAHAGGLLGGLLVTMLLRRLKPDIAHNIDGARDSLASAKETNSKNNDAIPAALIRLNEQLAFDRSAEQCQLLLKQTPNNLSLWLFYLDTATRCNQKRRDQAMCDALQLLNQASPPDPLVSKILQQYKQAGGDTSALSPPYRLLEAELYFRQKNAALAHQCASRLAQQWQHPRLEKLLTQLQIS